MGFWAGSGLWGQPQTRGGAAGALVDQLITRTLWKNDVGTQGVMVWPPQVSQACPHKLDAVSVWAEAGGRCGSLWVVLCVQNYGHFTGIVCSSHRCLIASHALLESGHACVTRPACHGVTCDVCMRMYRCYLMCMHVLMCCGSWTSVCKSRGYWGAIVGVVLVLC